eukprot:366341-Chlamydomonas_euryale.AAC.5
MRMTSPRYTRLSSARLFDPFPVACSARAWGAWVRTSTLSRATRLLPCRSHLLGGLHACWWACVRVCPSLARRSG